MSLDSLTAVERGLELLRPLWEPAGMNAWAGSPWRWVQDLNPEQRGGLLGDLLPIWAATQGVTLSAKGYQSGRATFDLLGRSVEAYLTTQQEGESYTFQTHQTFPRTEIVLLVGLAPLEARLWLGKGSYTFGVPLELQHDDETGFPSNAWVTLRRQQEAIIQGDRHLAKQAGTPEPPSRSHVQPAD